MTIPHELWLVALSVAIAIQGSFVGLSLSLEIDKGTVFRRRLALAGSALTLGTGVWSMHFVGMLAASFPSAIDYLVLPTLVSFLICVIVVGLGVYAAHAPGPPRMRIGLGAIAMGLGICLMHYVGMSAVHFAGPDLSGAAIRRRVGRRFHRGERACALVAGEPSESFAPLSRCGRAGLRDIGHALHGDGGDAARSPMFRRRAFRQRRVRAVPQYFSAVGNGDLVWRVRRLSALARSGGRIVGGARVPGALAPAPPIA